MENDPHWLHNQTCREYQQIVYFLHAPLAGKVKIGTTYRAQKRFEEIQSCSPVPLIYLGSVAGGEAVEAMWHRRSAKFHSHGEWFDYTAELQGMIAAAMILEGFKRITPSARMMMLGLMAREGYPNITDDDLRSGSITALRTAGVQA